MPAIYIHKLYYIININYKYYNLLILCIIFPFIKILLKVFHVDVSSRNIYTREHVWSEKF